MALTGAMARDGYLAASDDEPLVTAATLPAHVLDPVAVTVTRSGADFLGRLGINVGAGTAARCCVDWTEHRHHLAGAPGRAILRVCRDRGWLRPAPRSRALLPSDDGCRALDGTFGVDLGENPSR